MTAFDYIAAAARPHRPHVAYLRRWLPKAAQHVRAAPAQVSIALVGDTKMAALHEQFLNIPGPTDVLTFELDHDARGRCTSGEIVVCVPYAVREARRRRIDARREVLLYALHGLLHLSGYDDRTAADHKRMHRAEDRTLKAIGIGAVFDPPPR
ncbi:MAG TPA: rRNA maturation RNase YbeY [Tepidisphaeraceae bacterium]|jgi:probable rRNA maturation factor